MMFNVTVVEPPGYVHAQALDEAADYLVAMLRYIARRSRNRIEIVGGLGLTS